MAYYARPDEGVTITEEPDVIRVSSRGVTPVEYTYASSGLGGVSIVGNASNVVVCGPSRTIVEPQYEPVVTRTYMEPVVETTYMEPMRPLVVCEPVVQEYVSLGAQPIQRTYIPLESPLAEPRHTVIEQSTTEPVIRKYIALGDQVPPPQSPAVTTFVQQPQTVTTLASVPETAEADWVVVEKVPRTTVRHAYTGETSVGITSDGRYVIGEPNFGKPKGVALLSDSSDGLLKLPDGRIKYADGAIRSPSPVKTLLQGSIVQLSDGSVLLPDGTIEYPDGTVRKPTTSTYSAGIEYTEKAWNELQNNNNSNIQGLTHQITELKEQLSRQVETLKVEKALETADLKQKMERLQSEKYIYEKELRVLKETGSGDWAAALEAVRSELRVLQAATANQDQRDALKAKEERLRVLHEQFLAEARANAEARGLLQALQQERAREVESQRVAVSEAVLRREQELQHEKERAVAEAVQRLEQERDALLAEERAQAQAQAEQLLEQELSAERSRLQAELEQLQEFAEAQRQRAEEEHLLAMTQEERAVVAEGQLAALQTATPKKGKKKGKKKAKAKGKGKAKAKATPGVISGVRRLVGAVAAARPPARLVSKKAPAKRA
eukprot:GGOE01011920.1.p1 GENE.GGOE01011920.1~~GGOE01011920.1.p1  ORF type:complete len:616 (-),score=144.78 GGOE01011920.1:408-2234(-)